MYSKLTSASDFISLFKFSHLSRCCSFYILVKLTSMQLVGESVAAISVSIEAILKLENVDYYGKRLSESAVLLI